MKTNELIDELWRRELRAHWLQRTVFWRRQLIRQFVVLLRLHQDRKPASILNTISRIRDLEFYHGRHGLYSRPQMCHNGNRTDYANEKGFQTKGNKSGKD